MAKRKSVTAHAEPSRPSREALRKERKARWEAKVLGGLDVPRDLYNQEVVPGPKPPPHVDGKRLVQDLARLFSLTGDPIFEHAARVVSAYGLDAGSPAKAIKSVRQKLGLDSLDWYVEKMSLMNTSDREAAEEVAAKYGFKAATFEAAVEKLRKAKDDADLNDHQTAGATGRFWLVVENGKDLKDAEKIPDDRDGRSRLYSTSVWVKFE